MKWPAASAALASFDEFEESLYQPIGGFWWGQLMTVEVNLRGKKRWRHFEQFFNPGVVL